MVNRLHRLKAGQTTLEYAFIAAITAIILIPMLIYMNRSFQGRLKDAVDGLGGEHSLGSGSPSTTGPAFSADSHSEINKSSTNVFTAFPQGITLSAGGAEYSETTTINNN